MEEGGVRAEEGGGPGGPKTRITRGKEGDGATKRTSMNQQERDDEL
jgi:hypothetical protein